MLSTPIIPEFFDLLGVPFERGARGPNAYDCYGLVIELHRRAGVTLPDFDSPGSLEQVESLIRAETAQGQRWRKVQPRTVGAVVTLRVQGIRSHVGVMIEPDRFVHCVEHIGVTTERLTNGSFEPQGFYIYG